MFLPILKTFESFLSMCRILHCSLRETRLLAAVATIETNSSTSHYDSFVDFFYYFVSAVLS